MNKRRFFIILITVLVLLSIIYMVFWREGTVSVHIMNPSETTSSRTPIYIGAGESEGYEFSPIPNKIFSKMLYQDISVLEQVKINSTDYCLTNHNYTIRCAYEVFEIAKKYINKYDLNINIWSLYLTKVGTYTDVTVDYLWSLSMVSYNKRGDIIAKLSIDISARKGIITSFIIGKYDLPIEVDTNKLFNPKYIIELFINVSEININNYGKLYCKEKHVSSFPSEIRHNINVTSYNYEFKILIDNFYLTDLSLGIIIYSDGYTSVMMMIDYPLITLDKRGFTGNYCHLDKNRIKRDVYRIMGLDKLGKNIKVDIHISEIFNETNIIIDNEDLYLAPTYHVSYEIWIIVGESEYMYYGEIIYFAENCEIYDYDYWLD